MLTDLPVEVNTNEGVVVGLLVDTHLVPQQGQPQFGMSPDKKLIQGPQQMQLVLHALVAHSGGFIFCPIGAVRPILEAPPDQEQTEVELPPEIKEKIE